MLKIIAAVDKEMGIGKDGSIPWNYPKDMSFFKFMTTSLDCNNLIFGRKTFENIDVPLKNRKTYVLSRNKNGIKSEDPYLEYTTLHGVSDVKNAYVCGGEAVYEQTINKVQELVLTRINDTYNCDVFFPNFQDSFEIVSQFELSSYLKVQRWKRIN